MVSFAHVLLLTGCFMVINGQYSSRRRRPQIPNICARVLCPKPDCLNFETPPGGCCPVCPPTLPPHCAAAGCIQPDCSNPITPEGQCCPICPVTPPTICERVRCAMPEGCADTYTPDGQCCPVCRGGRSCFQNGEMRKDGETFKDSCNTCTCTNGHILCTKIACVSKPGRCPRVTIGRCVERCTDDANCRGRRKCCSTGCGHKCMRPVRRGRCDRECPQLRCVDQYTPPGQCCPICRPIENECNLVDCAPLSCINQYTPPGQCCPICRPPVKPDCTQIACTLEFCVGQYTPPGQCCPVCPRRGY